MKAEGRLCSRRILQVRGWMMAKKIQAGEIGGMVLVIFQRGKSEPNA